MVKVSVVIVNWNGGDLLRSCLSSLLGQTRRADCIFIVDNASSDNSFLCVADFPGVNLIESGANIGFAAANNLAFRECDSEYVALLNPDAIADPDWLASLLAAAESNPDYASFGSRQLIAERPDFLDGIGDNYHISGLPWRDSFGRRQCRDDLISRDIFSPCAAAALYRLDTLLEVGGFDEEHFCYLEDVDLGFRLRLAGYGSLYVPDAVVHHVGSATSGGMRSDFVLYHGHRNIVWTYVKNMPGFLFWLFMPLHLAVNFASLVVFSMQGRGAVIFKAKRDALKGLPGMWRKRKKIQAARRASLMDIFKVLNKGLSRK
jgi:GT2 family glycosyltransferase